MKTSLHKEIFKLRRFVWFALLDTDIRCDTLSFYLPSLKVAKLLHGWQKKKLHNRS